MAAVDSGSYCGWSSELILSCTVRNSSPSFQVGSVKAHVNCHGLFESVLLKHTASSLLNNFPSAESLNEPLGTVEQPTSPRSEERRAGKECRRGWPRFKEFKENVLVSGV